MFGFLKLLETKKFKYAGITLGMMGLTHISFFLMYPFLLVYSLIKKNHKEIFITILISLIITLSNPTLLELIKLDIEIAGYWWQSFYYLSYIPVLSILLTFLSFLFIKKNENHKIFYILFLSILPLIFIHARVLHFLFLPIIFLNGVVFDNIFSFLDKTIRGFYGKK